MSEPQSAVAAVFFKVENEFPVEGAPLGWGSPKQSVAIVCHMKQQGRVIGAWFATATELHASRLRGELVRSGLVTPPSGAASPHFTALQPDAHLPFDVGTLAGAGLGASTALYSRDGKFLVVRLHAPFPM